MHVLSLSLFMTACLLLVVQASPSFDSLIQKQSAAPLFRREAGSDSKRSSQTPEGTQRSVSPSGTSSRIDSLQNRKSSEAVPLNKGDLTAYAAKLRESHKAYQREQTAARTAARRNERGGPIAYAADPRESHEAYNQGQTAALTVAGRNERARIRYRQRAAALGKTVHDNPKKRSEPGEIAIRKQQKREFREQQDALVLERKRQQHSGGSTATAGQDIMAIPQSVNQDWQGGVMPVTHNSLNQDPISNGGFYSDHPFWRPTEAVRRDRTDISGIQNRGGQSEKASPQTSPRGSPSNLMSAIPQTYQNFQDHGIWQHTASGKENQSPNERSSTSLRTTAAADHANPNMVQMFQDFRNGLL